MAAPRLTWARELRFSPNRITSPFSSWIYIEWEIDTDLEGQRFAFCFFGSIKRRVIFITRSTEPLTSPILLPKMKCRLFSAW